MISLHFYSLFSSHNFLRLSHYRSFSSSFLNFATEAVIIINKKTEHVDEDTCTATKHGLSLKNLLYCSWWVHIKDSLLRPSNRIQTTWIEWNMHSLLKALSPLLKVYRFQRKISAQTVVLLPLVLCFIYASLEPLTERSPKCRAVKQFDWSVYVKL